MKRRHLVGLAALTLQPVWALPGTPRRIAVAPGPQAEVMDFVADLAARDGLTLQLQLRADGERVNAELAAGRLDAASVQDAVSFAQQVMREQLPLASAASTLTLPVALYSRRLRVLQQLPDGARIAVPAEPAVGARALLLLHNHGLIELRPGSGLQATARDVVGNRRRLRLQPLPSVRLVAALDSAELAVIPRDHAAAAGLLPARDSLGLEDSRTPYAGVLAVRADQRQQPWVAQLVRSYQSEPVKRFILARYQESVRRPW